MFKTKIFLMKQILILLVIIIVTIIGCTTQKSAITTVSHRQKAIDEAAAGNFQSAVQLWKNYFDQQNAGLKDIQVSDYAIAADIAYKSGNDQLAVSWYDAARIQGYTGEDMYQAFAVIFRKKQNLSRELTALEFIKAYFEQAQNITNIQSRLFEIYMEINRDKAFEQWNKLDNTTQKAEAFLNSYFILNREKDNKQLADSLADTLLLINPDHRDAIEWNGEKYYWLAENHYQREMAKYNKLKTHVQYQLLLNELKIVAEDFKRSRDYFEKLWALEKLHRYASYLANIYARLDNRERAEYFKKFAE